MEINFEIERFDKTRMLSEKEGDVDAAAIARVYGENYPECHLAADRIRDLEVRRDAKGINGLLEEGRVLFAAREKDSGAIFGLLEMREVKVDGGVYMQLAWLMVDRAKRESGTGSSLHEMFEKEAVRRSELTPRNTSQLLEVHDENPAKEIYKKWGYTNGEESKNGKVFMYKEVESERKKLALQVAEILKARRVFESAGIMTSAERRLVRQKISEISGGNREVLELAELYRSQAQNALDIKIPEIPDYIREKLSPKEKTLLDLLLQNGQNVCVSHQVLAKALGREIDSGGGASPSFLRMRIKSLRAKINGWADVIAFASEGYGIRINK